MSYELDRNILCTVGVRFIILGCANLFDPSLLQPLLLYLSYARNPNNIIRGMVHYYPGHPLRLSPGGVDDTCCVEF